MLRNIKKLTCHLLRHQLLCIGKLLLEAGENRLRCAIDKFLELSLLMSIFRFESSCIILKFFAANKDVVVDQFDQGSLDFVQQSK